MNNKSIHSIFRLGFLIFIFLSCLFAIKLNHVSAEIKTTPNNTNTYTENNDVQDPAILNKKTGIIIKHASNNYCASGNYTYINKKQAIDFANANCGDLYKTTKVYAQFDLLTDDHFSIEAISKDAINADPILKSKNKIEEIPVWIVSYEGTNIPRRNVILHEQVVFVDAISGKILYTLLYR